MSLARMRVWPPPHDRLHRVCGSVPLFVRVLNMLKSLGCCDVYYASTNTRNEVATFHVCMHSASSVCATAGLLKHNGSMVQAVEALRQQKCILYYGSPTQLTSP
jgi:hypothetical protein